MKKILWKIFKTILFLLGLVVICAGANHVLQNRNDPVWNNRKFQAIYKNKNAYDVLFCGTSMLITNISCQELYQKYGISSYSFAYPEQPMYLSYYQLKEALQYQKPKVIVFDAKAAFYTDEEVKTLVEEREYGIAHYSIDAMCMGRNKYDAIMETKEIKEDLNVWDYLSRMYYNHSGWNNITEGNFVNEVNVGSINGNMESYAMAQNIIREQDISEIENDGKTENISEKSAEYMQKIIDLCKAEDVNLVLVNFGIYTDWTWDRYNTVKAIADKNGVPYYDIDLLEKEAKLDIRTDTADGLHLNALGAQRWSDYFGKILKENYDLADHRGEKEYQIMEDQREGYDLRIDAMKEKDRLMYAMDFQTYLKALKKLDYTKNIVLITVKGDASKHFDSEDEKLFQELGLDTLTNQLEKSYVAIIDEEGARCKVSTMLPAEMELNYNEHVIKVVSGGKRSQTAAQFFKDEEAIMATGRGVNIVVYNRQIDQAISTVFFDTSKEENPKKSIIDSSGKRLNENDVNQWN